MSTAQVVEMSVTITVNNGPTRVFAHPDDHASRTYEMTPGFKPFTIVSKNEDYVVTAK